MGLRSWVKVTGPFVLSFLFISTASSLALAQQDSNNQMTPAFVSSGSADQGAKEKKLEYFIFHLYLNMYEAANGGMSVCGGDEGCLKRAEIFQDLSCAAAVCDGSDRSKKMLDCFPMRQVKLTPVQQLEKDQYQLILNDLNSKGCDLINNPGTETRQKLGGSLPARVENKLVELGAYLLALKGSAESCEEYIKDYVGAYGPQWNYRWYRAMSGCRILAHQTTREEEEKDFYTWFADCDGIRQLL